MATRHIETPEHPRNTRSVLRHSCTVSEHSAIRPMTLPSATDPDRRPAVAMARRGDRASPARQRSPPLAVRVRLHRAQRRRARFTRAPRRGELVAFRQRGLQRREIPIHVFAVHHHVVQIDAGNIGTDIALDDLQALAVPDVECHILPAATPRIVTHRVTPPNAHAIGD